jgi:hypothetical protein
MIEQQICRTEVVGEREALMLEAKRKSLFVVK